MLRVLVIILLALSSIWAETIGEKTTGMRRLDGYLPLYWDAKNGNLYMEISRWKEEFLLYTSLPAGLGSNDIGLDRGQLGDAAVVHFERIGPKVLLIETNRRFRTYSANAAERRAVAESFANSVHWGFETVAEEGDRVLIDLTPFVLRDGHRAIERIRERDSGAYRVEPARSAIYLERTRSFPRNTEVEVLLTLMGEPRGEFVSSVAPLPDSITLREHYSFVALPEPGYEPRAFDPRSSFIPLTFVDHSTPLGEPIEKRWIIRHRLGRSTGPIRYYLDPGVPEPVRSALLDGARWWTEAFAAAGFPNGFRVDVLPEDADPMDVRYNMINWVHRSTRGWSYGVSVVDPRTGEIIKGNVTLGSLRVRQDYMIAEGLLAPYEDGRAATPAMREMAVARLRQLAAHEVGHTLGLTHNFAASTNDRASVMDYPHPLITLSPGGKPDLRNAYATGVGDWDKAAILWGYGEKPEGVLEKAIQRGLRFLSDSDARPEGGASPVGHLWDNGGNAVDELSRILQVRRKVLEQFGERNIPKGRPMSELANVLVPMYMLHRYQTEAAAKVLGGVDYNYALRGDGQKIVEPIGGAEQRRALTALLRTIAPEELEIPERILALLPPRAFGLPATAEQFKSRTGLTFDPVAAAESAVHHTVRLLLHPERASRMEQLSARNRTMPSARDVIHALLSASWRAPAAEGLRGEIQKTTNRVVLHHLMALAANERASASAQAAAFDGLQEIHKQDRFAAALIDRFLRDGKAPVVAPPMEPPPGQPIGCEDPVFVGTDE